MSYLVTGPLQKSRVSFTFIIEYEKVKFNSSLILAKTKFAQDYIYCLSALRYLRLNRQKKMPQNTQRAVFKQLQLPVTQKQFKNRTSCLNFL